MISDFDLFRRILSSINFKPISLTVHCQAKSLSCFRPYDLSLTFTIPKPAASLFFKIVILFLLTSLILSSLRFYQIRHYYITISSYLDVRNVFYRHMERAKFSIKQILWTQFVRGAWFELIHRSHQ